MWLMVTALKEKSHFKYTYHCSQPIFCFLQPTALLSVILKNKIMTKLIKDNTLEEHYLNPKFHLYSWYKEDKCISRKGSGICNCFDQYVWTRLSKAQIYQWARIFFGQSSHCVVTQRAHTSRLRANASALYSELRSQCVQSACFVAWRLLSVLKIELPNHGRFWHSKHGF